jgi:hypothetical protein
MTLGAMTLCVPVTGFVYLTVSTIPEVQIQTTNLNLVMPNPGNSIFRQRAKLAIQQVFDIRPLAVFRKVSSISFRSGKTA